MKLDRLKGWRNNILLSEVGVLLHDLGKLSIEFNEFAATSSKQIFFDHECILRRYITNKFLFCTEAQFSNDLDREILSEDLRQAFENNEIAVSDNVTVIAENQQSKWLATDQDSGQTYIIEREGNQLNIYTKHRSTGMTEVTTADLEPILKAFRSLLHRKQPETNLTVDERRTLRRELVQEAIRQVRGENGLDWYFLFSVELAFQHDLDHSNTISTGLWQEFEDRSILMSQDATVETENSRWVITNKDKKRYRVIKEDGQLKIYARHSGSGRDSVRDRIDRIVEVAINDEAILDDFLPEPFVSILNQPCILFAAGFTLQIPKSFETEKPGVSLGDFMKRNPDLASGLRSLLAQSDIADSGGDKGLPAVDSKQDGPDFFDSSSFGIESKLDPDQMQLARQSVCDALVTFWNKLKSHFVNEENQIDHKEVETEEWYNERDRLFARVKGAFSQAIAETRRSANDVSLWHHSYAVATLFKSSMAGQLINDQKAKIDEWSILAVKFDVFSLLERAYRIGDIIGTVDFIQNQLCPAIKLLIEVAYPLGNEIYRDESGIYFTFPAFDDWQDKNPIAAQVLKELKALMARERKGDLDQKIWDAIQTVRDLDLPLSLSTSEPSRFLVKIGDVIESVNRVVEEDGKKIVLPLLDGPMPNWTEWQIGVSLCPVCQVRPENENRDDKICQSCAKRRNRRLIGWLDRLNPKKPTPTIWLSEIADNNRRIALITGQFGLSNWTNGIYVDSTFSQSLLVEQTPLGTKPQSHATYGELITDLGNYNKEQFLDTQKMPTDLLDRVVRQEVRQKGKNQEPENSFKTDGFIKERNYRIEKPSKSDQEFAHFLTSKHPVPSRLRRVWQTTQDFWEVTVKRIFADYFSDKGYQRQLLVLKPITQAACPNDLEDQKVYEDVQVNGRLCSAIYRDGKFVVLDNVSDMNIRPGQNLQLRLENLHHIPCEADVLDYQYIPAITLHTSPISFMAIAPAEDAIEIIKKIRDEYEEQFSKVANRLSLSIGTIFFAELFPLYVVIDAARRMMDGFKRREKSATIAQAGWKVINKKPTENGEAVKLTLSKEEADKRFPNRDLKREVSVKLGDAQKTDVFYPYFIHLNQDQLDKETPKRRYFLWPNPDFKDDPSQPEYLPLVHVLDLEENDQICHLESRFDFAYLDSIKEITSLHYDEKGQRRQTTKFRGDRNWGLHRIEEIEKLFKQLTKYLTLTQIRQIRETLIETIGRWQLEKPEDDVYRRFVKAVLQRAGNGKLWRNVGDENDRKWLVDCCVSGLLFDVLELYLTALKVRTTEKEKLEVES